MNRQPPQPTSRQPPALRPRITDLQSLNPWRFHYSNGNGHETEGALGASGTYLRSGGAAAAPAFAAPVMSEISDLPVLSSGVYTPTRSAEANLDSNVTMSEAQYLRVGATVTVSGRFTADPTLTVTTTSFEITLPVASNIGAAEDVAGIAFCGAIAGQGAAIYGVAANDTAKVEWVSGDVTSQVWSYTFTYQVI